jgi:hypothetical protein
MERQRFVPEPAPDDRETEQAIVEPVVEPGPGAERTLPELRQREGALPKVPVPRGDAGR